MTEKIDTIALRKKSTERSRYGAYCTISHVEVVALIDELEALRLEVTRQQQVTR
jgi:hypothetical protein